jgi:hypothetical protein
MRKCSYCGRENSDDAVNCFECGHEVNAEGIPVKQPSHWLLRMAIGVGVGLAVTLLSLFVAWQNIRSIPYMSIKQYITSEKLQQLAKTFRDWQTNSAPITLDEVQKLVGTNTVDGWGHPLNIVQDGSNFMIVSYGRDEKLGGIGLDCDLTSRDLWPRQSLPTLLQFYRDLPSTGIVKSCIFSGVLALITSLLAIKLPTLNRQNIIRACWKLGATIIGAVLVSIFISELHIPSGH